MKKTKLLEDLFIISWLLMDTFWIFDQLVFAIFAFLISATFCCFYGIKLIDDKKEYINVVAALLWLLSNGLCVVQDLFPIVPTYLTKISIILALVFSIILKLKNSKTN